jgi:hypothetical protein
MPTSKMCGQCVACHKYFAKGERAMFVGNVRILQDKLEPGTGICFHDIKTACKVSHIQSDERGMICMPCWANIKSGYFRNDTAYKEYMAKFNSHHKDG